MKTLIETNSSKKLFVYDSFEGLPPLSKWEENTGWRAGTLKSTEEILTSNFEQNKRLTSSFVRALRSGRAQGSTHLRSHASCG